MYINIPTHPPPHIMFCICSPLPRPPTHSASLYHWSVHSFTTYLYIRVLLHIHTFVTAHSYVRCVCIYGYTYQHTNESLCTCTHINTRKRVCVRVHISTHKKETLYLCTYQHTKKSLCTCTHINTQRRVCTCNTLPRSLTEWILSYIYIYIYIPAYIYNITHSLTFSCPLSRFWYFSRVLFLSFSLSLTMSLFL